MKHLYVCNCIRRINLPEPEDHLYNLHQTNSRIINKAHQVKNAILFTFILLGFGQVCWGQAIGDYRSKIGSTSNWGASTSWERYNGTAWEPAPSAPGSTFAYDIIIQQGTVILLNTNGKAKALTINGVLNINSNKTLTVTGNLINNGTFAPASNHTGGSVAITGNFTNIGSFNNGNNAISISGNFTNDGTYTGGTSTITISANFTNNNIFISNSSNVILNGTSSQIISGTKVTDFNTLTISNIDAIVSANKNFNVNSEMILSDKSTFEPDPSVIINLTSTTSSRFLNGPTTGSGKIKVTRIEPGSADFQSQYRFTNYSIGFLTVEYTGTEAQQITIYKHYDDLIINNTSQAGCALVGNAIALTLRIITGKLTVSGSSSLNPGNMQCGILNILSSGSLILNNFSQTICTDLTIDIGGGQLIVSPGGILTVLGKTTLGDAECLILKSDATPLTGSFIHSDSFLGSGTVKVERYMSHSNNWHLYCSPIGFTSAPDQGIQVLESVHDFLKNNNEIPYLVNTDSVGMRDYNIAKNIWNPYFVYENGNLTAPPGYMEIGKGFSIRTSYNLKSSTNVTIYGSGSIDAIGIPNSNSFDVTLLRSADALNLTDKGWNCIGNPFTTAIDIQLFLTDANMANLEYGAVYIWDTNNITKTYPTPGYIALNLSGDVSDITTVQIGQGFFVKSVVGGGSVNFNSDMQITTGAGLSFKSAAVAWPSINIIAQGDSLSSSTKIKFITNTTKGLDRGYDAGMLKANPNFALYSKLLVDNAADFCIQCLPGQNYDQYVIPIGLDCKVAGNITFTAETINLPSGCQALLEDRLTKQFTKLDLKDAKYTATVGANTKGTGRFFLHTSDVISGDQPVEKEQFKISKIGKTLYINGDVSDKANFFVYSVNGKQLLNFKAESQVQNQFDVSGFPAGVYILTVDDQNQKKSVKFLIEN